MLPSTNFDVTTVTPSTITNLRFSSLQDSHPGRIGLAAPMLKRVPTGVSGGGVVTTLDKPFARVPRLQAEPLVRAERDFLLYHDLDFALFHYNVRDNVQQRLDAWKASRALAPPSVGGRPGPRVLRHQHHSVHAHRSVLEESAGGVRPSFMGTFAWDDSIENQHDMFQRYMDGEVAWVSQRLPR